MFNLIMGASAEDATIAAEPLFEYTEDSLATKFREDLSQLTRMPALVMPELQDQSRPQVARVGHVTNVSLLGRNCHYQFVPEAGIPVIPSSAIESMAPELLIDERSWEFSRTHWAVKDTDLYRTLLLHSYAHHTLAPTVFTIPATEPDPDLVSVMMPFDATFAPVYQAISEAATQEGWKCQRADEIFNNGPIIQDIVNLIAGSQAVICDLSGRNANVFYEAGIAHTIGRNVLLLARDQRDVPFDLQHLRYISYTNNTQGLGELKDKVLKHLEATKSANR